VRWAGTGWDGLDGDPGPDAVDTEGIAGYDTSIVLDAAGFPHISYYCPQQPALRYVRWAGTGWDGLDGDPGPDGVETSVLVGMYASLALDSEGCPHLSYLDAGNLDLKYARYEQ
jgi:hypothetical protein